MNLPVLLSRLLSVVIVACLLVLVGGCETTQTGANSLSSDISPEAEADRQARANRIRNAGGKRRTAVATTSHETAVIKEQEARERVEAAERGERAQPSNRARGIKGNRSIIND